MARNSVSSSASRGYAPGREAGLLTVGDAPGHKQNVLQQGIGFVGNQAACSPNRYGTTFKRIPGRGPPVYATVIAEPRKTRSQGCRDRIKKAMDAAATAEGPDDINKAIEALEAAKDACCIQGSDSYMIPSREVNVVFRKIDELKEKLTQGNEDE
mmetsp:Transcript_57602/g.91606  ORF Transcript_57602/g.91606 Transcript_57602/m.91606 type:complete len:155 (-) Transcript_57602:8-472(-)